MNIKRMLLTVGAVALVAVSATRAHAAVGQPLVVIDPAGSVRIQQELPCNGKIDIVRKVISGRIEVVPSEVVNLRVPTKYFDLTAMQLKLEPFSAQGQCLGVSAVAQFYDIGLMLMKPVRLAIPSAQGRDAGNGRYEFTLLPDDFTLFETVRDNYPVKQPEQRYVKPTTTVSIIIDLKTPPVAIAAVAPPQPHIEIAFGLSSLMHFKAGPIDQQKPGTQDGTIGGDVVPPTADQDGDGVPDLVDNCPALANPDQEPDKVAPVVSCTRTRRPSDAFLVTATDMCTGKIASIRLGSFPIDNGEVIKIEETGKKGSPVTLRQNDGRGVRNFQVGKGGAIITATDLAGNVGSAACKIENDKGRDR